VLVAAPEGEASPSTVGLLEFPAGPAAESGSLVTLIVGQNFARQAAIARVVQRGPRRGGRIP